MSDVLPAEISAAIEEARRSGRRGRHRLRVEIGGQSLTLLRLWKTGFAVDGNDAPRVRGLVDIYDGARHLSHCLVMAAAVENGEVRFEFKRATPAADRAPRDFAPETPEPAGLIGPA